LEDRLCLSLFLGNYFGSDVLEFDETTGATIGVFGEANNADSGLQFPVGVLFGPDGNLYVTNESLNTISRFDGQTGAFIDDFGEANNADSGLTFPNGVIFGPDGDLFVSSAGHGMTSSTSPMGAILRFDGSTGAFEGVFGEANFTDSTLRVPIGLVFGPDGDLYVASAGGLPGHIDPDFSAILRYDGTTGAFKGTFGDADRANSGLVRPQALVFGPDGNLYVSSTHTDEVLKYNGTTGAFLGVFGEANNADSGLTGPVALLFGPGGDLFVVRTRFNIINPPPGGVIPPPANSEDVLRYDGQTGQFLGVFAADAGLDIPTHLVFTNTNPTTLAYENEDNDNTAGLYDSVSGKFFLRNSNSAGVGDVVFRYGPTGAGWTAIVGDWDSDGDDTVGLYDPVGGRFFLKKSNTAGAGDIVFRYGPAGVGWTPVVGNWAGPGVAAAGTVGARAQSIDASFVDVTGAIAIETQGIAHNGRSADAANPVGTERDLNTRRSGPGLDHAAAMVESGGRFQSVVVPIDSPAPLAKHTDRPTAPGAIDEAIVELMRDGLIGIELNRMGF
jgi:sugar lactone lactonase YvrE